MTHASASESYVGSTRQRIHQAIRAADIQLLEALFTEHPSEIQSPGLFGSYLHFAASQGNLSVVRFCVDLGMDVNWPGERDGILAIKMACWTGAHEVVRFLLGQGSRLDVSLSIRNPLFGCISGYVDRDARPQVDFLECAKLLLGGGIDASAKYTSKTMVDMDATAFAWMWGRRDIAWLLACHLHGDDEEAVKAALWEADVVATGNATSREKFRRLRYPPKPRGKKQVD